MVHDPKSSDTQAPANPAGGPPPDAAPDQRRNRGDHGPSGGKTEGDQQRREVAEGDTSGGSPMDPQDEAFLKTAK